MDAEYARKLQEEINKEHEESYKNIDWNAALDHVQSKEPQYIKRYHGIKKKPQTESEARKNMISYLKNTEGYKIDFFKGMKYDEIEEDELHAAKPIPAAKPKTLTITTAPAVSTRRRKRVVIRDPEEELHTDTRTKTPTVKDKGKGILIEDPKPMKKKDQTREEMEKEDEEIIKSINEIPAQKAAKRRKLGEEAQEADDLRRNLEIVQDEDDDVFVEAIPLAQKVSVVDYQAKVKAVQDAAAVAHAK
uniref:Uncharacterized protein n=1 Tax=Tanacetum cinerariifolium TaxID=118510 RepID=A0A699IY65_TANCI|nr:hypothetical protein [Tanacetum cinerariifolium]